MKLNIKALLLLAIACIVFAKTHAQTEIQAGSKTYSQVFDSLSTGLIPSRIPYGTLIDRTYIWSGLDAWKNNDTTSIRQLYQGWYDAEQAVINPANRPNRYSNMRTKVQQQIYLVRLPLIILNYRFGYFDSLSITDGRLGINNGMMTDNNLASPYLTKQVGIAGIALDKLQANKNYALQYDTSLALNNTGTTIANVVITNITTGQVYTIANQAAVLASFSQVGNNILKFTTLLSNGSSYNNYQTVKVENSNSPTGTLNRPDGPSCDPSNEIVESKIPFQGYEETIATNSFADYHIYYHTTNLNGNDNCQRILKKPIIIIDGFDPQDGRSYSEIYKDQLVYSSNLTKLGDELRDKGYDVIILNFPKLGSTINGVNGVPNKIVPKDVKVNGTTSTVDRLDRDGGTDYMERNAFLLVKLIQQVNDSLITNGSTEKLVVIGPSMGGQISRYALAYMEKQNSLGVPFMNHNTRLFLSFDSPNDGANIPLALAHDLRFFGTLGGNQVAKDNYDQQLHSIAARQLLIEQYDGLNSTASFHQTFFNNIRNGGLPNSGGYPVNLRKVTLLNGNGNSIKTYDDAVDIIKLHGNISLVGNTTATVFKVENSFMPSTGQSKLICVNRIVIPKSIRFFWGSSVTFPSKIINYSATLPNFNLHGSMDAIQGSTFDATKDVYTGFTGALTAQGITNQNTFAYLPLHCFIPSVSALAFRNPNFNWNNNVVNRNLLCNNEIWFDNYFIPKTNEKHITLTTENVDWITQEIDKGQPNCPKICSFSLNTTSNYCLNSVITLSFDVPAPAGCTVTCEQSTRYDVISVNNNGVTIRITQDGQAIVVVKIINPCGANVLITKNIYAGNPTLINATYVTRGIESPMHIYPYQIDSPEDFTCIGAGVRLDVRFAGANVVTLTGTRMSSGFPPYNNGYFYFTGYNQGLTLRMSGTNGCGTTNFYSYFGSVYCPNVCNQYRVSPNPTTGDRVIIDVPPPSYTAPCARTSGGTIEEPKVTNTDLTIAEVKLYDNNGTLRKIAKVPNQKEVTLDISGLVAGSYQIQISGNGYTETQTIIIRR